MHERILRKVMISESLDLMLKIKWIWGKKKRVIFRFDLNKFIYKFLKNLSQELSNKTFI